MLKMFCDNCGRELKDKPDEVNKGDSSWKPDARGHLLVEMEQEGTGKSRILDKDLCFRCTKAYVKKLKEPLDY